MHSGIVCKKPLRLIFALRNCLQKTASLNFCTPELFAKNRFA
ncbi:Uncharacterized protein dnm_029330 [Desulfonema magnum]|nr:Uncharacterized protein dnm_029330 [Desulfonema magnum]